MIYETRNDDYEPGKIKGLGKIIIAGTLGLFPASTPNLADDLASYALIKIIEREDTDERSDGYN